MYAVESDEEVKRKLAYESTNSDQEAASLLEMPMTTFRHWRQRRGLEAKGNPLRSLKHTKLTLEEIRAKLMR